MCVCVCVCVHASANVNRWTSLSILGFILNLHCTINMGIPAHFDVPVNNQVTNNSCYNKTPPYINNKTDYNTRIETHLQ